MLTVLEIAELQRISFEHATFKFEIYLCYEKLKHYFQTMLPPETPAPLPSAELEPPTPVPQEYEPSVGKYTSTIIHCFVLHGYGLQCRQNYIK